MLAIKPNKDEAFLREVDEELRKERMNAMFARYGWLVIAGVVLLLAAIGGWIWYQEHRKAVAGEQGEALISALQAAESGNTADAQATFDELAESNIEAYRAAGLFSRAGLQLEAGDEAAAIATLKAIAEDSRLAEPYRHAALIRQTRLRAGKDQKAGAQAAPKAAGNLSRPLHDQGWRLRSPPGPLLRE
jgi:hypothetical protein